MIKFDFESDEMRNVSKSLGKAVTNIDKIINVVESLDIPDFSYKKVLSGLPDEFGKLKYSIVSDDEWVINAISVLESYNNDSIDGIEGIEVHSYFDKSTNIKIIE